MNAKQGPQGFEDQMWRLGIWVTAGLFLSNHSQPPMATPPALPSFQGYMPSTIPKSRHSPSSPEAVSSDPSTCQASLVRQGPPGFLPLALTQ